MSICSTCNREITNPLSRDITGRYNMPFYCKECRQMNFNYIPLRNLVFIWPSVPPESIAGIIIPENVRYAWRDEYGIVLAIGKGYWTKKGKFIQSKLKVGDIVIYDKDVPWKTIVDGYEVKYMGTNDIKGVIDDSSNS